MDKCIYCHHLQNKHQLESSTSVYEEVELVMEAFPCSLCDCPDFCIKVYCS